MNGREEENAVRGLVDFKIMLFLGVLASDFDLEISIFPELWPSKRTLLWVPVWSRRVYLSTFLPS